MNRLAPIAGVILAGGPSSRMGGVHKAGRMLAGAPLLEHVIRRFAPQVDRLLINLNDALPGVRYDRHTLIADREPNRQGPLSGLASAFDYLDAVGDGARAVAVVPCDGPFLPDDLVARLATAMAEGGGQVACVRYQGYPQPTFSLWRRDAAATVLQRHRAGEGGLRAVIDSLDTVWVDWPAEALDPFYNINTPGELAEAEQRLEVPS